MGRIKFMTEKIEIFVRNYVYGHIWSFNCLMAAILWQTK